MKLVIVSRVFCTVVVLGTKFLLNSMDCVSIAPFDSLLPDKVMGIAKNLENPPVVRVDALKWLINQRKSDELQAQARIIYAEFHLLGMHGVNQSFDQTRQLLAPIEDLQITDETRKRARWFIGVLNALRDTANT